MMSVDWLSDLGSVEGILDEWRHLYDRGQEPHPFLHPDWALNWWQAFEQPTWEPRVLTVRRQGELVAVGPLLRTLERRWGRNCRALRLWANAYSNRAGVLVAEDGAGEALEVMARAFAERSDWDVAVLQSVPLEDRTTTGLVEALRGVSVLVGVRETFASPFVELPATTDEMDDRLGRSFRRSLRTKLNRLEAQHPELSFLSGGEGVDVAMDISRDTWQHEAGTGIGSTESNLRFFRGMAERPWLRERLRVALLSLSGRSVAFEWNLQDAGTIYNLKVGYRKESGGHSPGLVLRHHTLDRTISEGLTEFDFLGEKEAYKMHWAGGVRLHGDLYLYRAGAFGSAAFVWTHRVKPWLRNVPGFRGLAGWIRRFGR